MNLTPSILLLLGILLLFMLVAPTHPTQPSDRPLRQQRINFQTPARRRDQANKKIPHKYWGDYLGPKNPEHFRCYLQNPNRISPRDDFVDFGTYAKLSFLTMWISSDCRNLD
jgi:hypothetical protein